MNKEIESLTEEKLYVVYQHEPYGESRACAFFKNPLKAQNYADCQNKVDSMCDYYVHEDTFNDNKWADNTKALKLYEYVINTDDTIEQADEYNDKGRDFVICPFGKTDFFKTELMKYHDHTAYIISAYSGVSFNDARARCLKEYDIAKRELNANS